MSDLRAGARDHSPRALRVDVERLIGRIEALGEIGAVHGPNGERGCARLALTDADRDGRDLVVTWMHDLGLTVEIDAIGNVFATRPGRDPALAPVMTGSHIDTVRTGGRFDGNLGVLAGLEVLETLIANDVATERGITVAFFTDEEGARFAPDMLGSLVYVGGMALEDALDVRATDARSGEPPARLGDELDRIGYAGSLPCPAATFPHRYVELHIEQGPVLEEAGIEIGVVTGVQGISWTELTITGQSAHAGTTPMRLRHDPGYAAAEIAVAARRIAAELGGSQVATVGRLELTPNLVNVVPSTATLTVDLRNTDEAQLRRAEAMLAARIDELETSEGVLAGHHRRQRAVERGPLLRFGQLVEVKAAKRVGRLVPGRGGERAAVRQDDTSRAGGRRGRVHLAEGLRDLRVPELPGSVQEAKVRQQSGGNEPGPAATPRPLAGLHDDNAAAGVTVDRNEDVTAIRTIPLSGSVKQRLGLRVAVCERHQEGSGDGRIRPPARRWGEEAVAALPERRTLATRAAHESAGPFDGAGWHAQ